MNLWYWYESSSGYRYRHQAIGGTVYQGVDQHIDPWVDQCGDHRVDQCGDHRVDLRVDQCVHM